jgi:group I intron endonuclease
MRHAQPYFPGAIPGVYRLRCLPTGRAYVGSTQDTRRRFRDHRFYLRHGKHPCKELQEAWDEFGEDAFEWAILDVSADLDRLHILEQSYIDTEPNPFNKGKAAPAEHYRDGTLSRSGHLLRAQKQQLVVELVQEHIAKSR